MKFLESALSLEQHLHKRITATGTGRCSASWSSLASRARITQAGGHRGQGTTLERVSSLPAPAAEPRQPERKKGALLVALTAELSAGNIGAVMERRTHCCPSQNGLGSLRGGIDHPCPP